jgi:hypothetical protein
MSQGSAIPFLPDAEVYGMSNYQMESRQLDLALSAAAQTFPL